MKKLLLRITVFTLVFVGCQDKKLTEVVEVPLPDEAPAVVAIGNPDHVRVNEGTFPLYKIPYTYDALEPHLDTKTMELHYAKHYANYVNRANELIKGTSYERLATETILSQLSVNQAELRNQLGGYYNHTVWFKTLSAKPDEASAEFNQLINTHFGSLQELKSQLTAEATAVFGSGWAWLVITPTGKLAVTSTKNQDNPLMPGAATVIGTPIFGIDVWEHSYYLKFNSNRGSYTQAVFEVTDWKKVEALYTEARARIQ